jgi:hypothetical protein
MAVIKQIQNVLKTTILPSWINRPPLNFGEASVGSLPADEWRTLALIHLPLALVVLWGDGSHHPSSKIAKQHRLVLDHTMELFSAIRLAALRTTTENRITAFQIHMRNYIRDLPKLHPQASAKPYQHIAMHIPDFLRLFGPVRSWWCFPFERLIGILQRLPTNHKFGKYSKKLTWQLLTKCLGYLEQTLLNSFLKASRIKHWLARPDCPPAIKECRVLFDRYLSQNSPRDAPRPIPPVVEISETPPRIQYDGLTYARSGTHLGNSLILFSPNGDTTAPPVPGQIKQISTSGNTISFYVSRYLSLGSGIVDPFQPYIDFPIWLYSSKMNPHLELVNVSWVAGHFALCPISAETIAVVSLSRVS